ncbi:MAG: hypothetical protein U0R81_05945 [Mycobacterium sp.]
MSSGRLTRRIAVFAGGVAIVGMGALTSGCTNSEQEAPSTTTTPSSSPSATPTEKAVSPGGPNSFSPTVDHQPGPICTSINGNNCSR